MGCVESNPRHSDVEEETDRAPQAPAPAPEPAPAKQRKKKKRKKISLRKKSSTQKKEGGAETSRSESTKVTVIWRRWSLFNSAHEIFNKRLEGETPGPSGRLAQASQISNLSTEIVVRSLDRAVS